MPEIRIDSRTVVDWVNGHAMKTRQDHCGCQESSVEVVEPWS